MAYPLTHNELSKINNGSDITDEQMEKLYAYYLSGEDEIMPYGIAKARDGDPYNWIADKVYEFISRGF